MRKLVLALLLAFPLCLAVCLAWAASAPDFDKLAGQAADIAPSAYPYRGDRPAARNVPEAEFLFRALAHKREGTLCGLLWEEPRPVRQVVLRWPASAAPLPRPEQVVLRWFPVGDSASWWCREGEGTRLREAQNPSVSDDGRVFTYSLNALSNQDALDNLVVAWKGGADRSVMPPVPEVKVLAPQAWKRMDVAIEWGFQADKEAAEYDGRIEAYNGMTGQVAALPEDRGTRITGPDRWESRPAAGSHRRGLIVPLLWLGYEETPVWPGQAKIGDVNRTVVTVRTSSGAFSFLPADLERGPILAPEHGFFAARASQAITARAHATELASRGLRTLRQQVHSRPEQSWEGAMRAVHSQVQGEFPPYPRPAVTAPMEVDVPETHLRAAWKVGATDILRSASKGPDGKWRFRDLPYQALAHETHLLIRVLDLMGLHREARDGYEMWLKRADNPAPLPDGRWTGGPGTFFSGIEWDNAHSGGISLVHLGMLEHYRLTRDRAWLKANAAKLNANADWIVRQRKKFWEDTLAYSSEGNAGQPAARPPAAVRKESHPILLLRPDQAEQYKPRVADMPEKTKTFGLTTDIMLAAMIDYLRGRRCEEAVADIRKSLASKDAGRIAYAVLIYDIQYPFLTPAERTTFREQFLAWVEPIYQNAVKQNHWMYDRRALNNWTYGFGGRPLQNLLFIGLAFPEHPRSALYVAKGKQLLTWVLEGGPNNGTWNEKRGEFDVYPTKVDMIDESLSAAPVYGLGGLDNLLMVMHVLNNATDDRPFERFDRMMHSEGRWWTYNLGYKEKIHYFRNASCFASYTNSVGHGHFQPLSKFWSNNQQFLYLALQYNDPVLAWHHYANPGSIGSPDNRQFIENGLWKVKSFKDQQVSWDMWTFLSWGMVAPKSAEEAGWPLTEFWPNAGSFVMRKSWARNVRVSKPGEKTGVIVGWGGPGGSKDRVFFGTVRYDADDHQVLGCAPFSGTGGPPALFGHPGLQNVLAVDGVAEQSFGNIRFNRLRHGVTTRLGPDTFLMDMSPQDRPDYLSVYAHLPVGGVWWTRKVHYDREKDILWIKDVASTGDKKPHKLRFNWVNSGPELIDAETIKLSGGYYLVAKSLDSGSQLKSEVNTHRDAYEEFQAAMKRNPPEMAGEPYAKEPDYYIWKSVYSGVDAPSAQIVWAVGKDPAALREYLQTEH